MPHWNGGKYLHRKGEIPVPENIGDATEAGVRKESGNPV